MSETTTTIFPHFPTFSFFVFQVTLLAGAEQTEEDLLFLGQREREIQENTPGKKNQFFFSNGELRRETPVEVDAAVAAAAAAVEAEKGR